MASRAGKTYQLGPCYQTVVALTRSRTTTSVIPAQAGTHGPDCLPSHNRKTHQPVRLTKKEVVPEIGQPPRLSGEGRNPENPCERAPPLNEEGRHFIAPYAPGNR